MPQLGETVAEGKISTWFKQVGDAVKPGDNLFEIETDKVSMEVPATSAGVIAEIRVVKGEVAPVGAVVAVIADVAEAAAAHKPAAKEPVKSPSARKASSCLGRGSSRKTGDSAPIAMDPFREVRTSGTQFRSGEDRRRHGDAAGAAACRRERHRFVPHSPAPVRMAASSRAMSSPASPARPRRCLASGASASDIVALYRDVPFEEVPLDGMRKTIAARLTQAKQTIPHFYLTADIGMDALLKVRAEANDAAPQKDGEPIYKISVNDFVIKALALALKRVPAANAILAQDRILRFQRADIGVAVALEGGLLTPVIRAADEKSLSAISNEMRSLAERARDKKLKPEEYQGGVSAISNLGMYGVREFSAIINPPQSTILAVGAAQRRPVETEDGGVRFESQMTVTLSCDHRVIDGALGAQLLAALKGYLEQPVTMLV